MGVLGAPNIARKCKRTHEQSTPVIDVDLWLHEARQANDWDAIQWFTRTIHLPGKVRQKVHKRPRMLNVLHHRWLRLGAYAENLARTHTHIIAYTY